MREQLIKKIMDNWPFCTTNEAYNIMKETLEKHLPDFNPYKIDEERFGKLYDERACVTTYANSITKHIIDKYNSTLPPALKTLPECEMPSWFHGGVPMPVLWNKIVREYGTPANNLQPLPSVDELVKEMISLWHTEGSSLKAISEHLHSKYGTQPREWWQDLKEGDKFKFQGNIKVFDGTISKKGGIFLGAEDTSNRYSLSYCTPYTTPTASEIIAKYNLTEEEVRLIREGK